MTTSRNLDSHDLAEFGCHSHSPDLGIGEFASRPAGIDVKQTDVIGPAR